MVVDQALRVLQHLVLVGQVVRLGLDGRLLFNLLLGLDDGLVWVGADVHGQVTKADLQLQVAVAEVELVEKVDRVKPAIVFLVDDVVRLRMTRYDDDES